MIKNLQEGCNLAQKALIAMSGGVDSSVAAYLAIAGGYECAGATMQLLSKDDGVLTGDAEDARLVADKLGIPFHVFPFCQEFRKLVMDVFVHAYEQGLTPNPCVVCNRTLKFGLFLDKAIAMGYDKIVTGHYARIRYDESNGRFQLLKAPDAGKDQSYFLYGLTQTQLRHTLFPLGELTKEEARRIAAEQGFVNAQKRDSQDICFVPDGDYYAFIRRHTGKEYPAGNFLDLDGNVIGTHNGAIGYTLGQRKGLGIALGAPAYVCQKDMAANTVTLGSNDALFHRRLRMTDCNWIAISKPDAPIRVSAKARSRMMQQPASVYPEADGSYLVEFDEPQRAITPGQAIVLYDGDLVIGGGTIREVV